MFNMACIVNQGLQYGKENDKNSVALPVVASHDTEAEKKKCGILKSVVEIQKVYPSSENASERNKRLPPLHRLRNLPDFDYSNSKKKPPQSPGKFIKRRGSAPLLSPIKSNKPKEDWTENDKTLKLGLVAMPLENQKSEPVIKAAFWEENGEQQLRRPSLRPICTPHPTMRRKSEGALEGPSKNLINLKEL